jgi:hypothetical protein
LKILDQQRINPADVAFGFPEKNQVQQEKSKLSEFALNSATKIVQNFQNPKLPEEKTGSTHLNFEEFQKEIFVPSGFQAFGS